MAASNLPVAYLNGVYLPLDEARVSPLDRGFLFGDGVYEVIPCYGGRLFRLEPHIERLERSLREIHLTSPLSHAEWQAMLDGLVERNGGGHQTLYLQVTRGAATTRDQRFPDNCPATVFAFATRQEHPDSHPPAQETGARCITCDDIRWARCDIKAVSLLANILLRHEAQLAGADEAILIRNGHVTEGSSSNVFLLTDGQLQTPPLGPEILGGVTRDLIIELAHQHGIAIAETPVSLQSLNQASEIWISSSTRGVRPVVQLNGQAVGDGRPGALWRTMAEHYAAFRRDLMAEI